MTETMPAWRRETYGSAEGFRLERVPVPVPGPGEVRVKVRATSLNAGDVRLMRGDPLLVRPVFGLRRPRYPVRGMDIAGTVVATAAGVAGIGIGDEVMGELVGGGGLAGFALIDAARLVPVPPGIDPAVAACLPVAGGTAWQALDLAGVGPSARPSRVLIIGASGGVGTFAVPLAALRGAEVWATCAERARPLVEGLGAVRTFDHRCSPLSALPAAHFDAVIDVVGGTALRELQRLTAPAGAIALVSGDGGPVLGPVPRMLRAALLSLGRGPRIRMLAATSRPEVLTGLLELVTGGRLSPVIEREYPFTEARAALAHIEAGHTLGKVVVRGA